MIGNKSKSLVAFATLLLTNFFQCTIHAWPIIVISDFHGAETFSFNTDTDQPSYQNSLKTLLHIRKFYGGEVMMLPGDTQSGYWHEAKYIKKHFPNLSIAQAVYRASINCYTTLRSLFTEAGYDKILMAVGDHELGDNGWFAGSDKANALESFRNGFRFGFNSDQKNYRFLYGGWIGQGSSRVPTTPIGNVHEKLSHAYQHNNVMFITIDIYEQMSKTQNYLDKSTGRGGEGIVTGRIRGQHLEWFEDVLKAANADSSVDHIIVQAHIPVKEPVRKAKSSAMSVDDGEQSGFWKMMEKYNVDLYVCGKFKNMNYERRRRRRKTTSTTTK